MERFATSYGFKHRTSSPRYPQSNGQVERAVQTIKNLLRKSDDPFLSLLVYRSTPLQWCDKSPAELCKGRQLNTNLLLLQDALIPKWSYISQYRQDDKVYKESNRTMTGDTVQECYLNYPMTQQYWLTIKVAIIENLVLPLRR